VSLQKRLDALKAECEANTSHEVLVIMRRTIEVLIVSGQAERALKAGDHAPSFNLVDTNGCIVSSAELLKKGPLVLVFYLGVWCPYCNLELQAVEAVTDQIRATGATLVALSPQTPANSRKARRINRLGFPILSDGANSACLRNPMDHA
jgi:peroxiredoxin